MLPSTYKAYSIQVLGYFEPDPSPVTAEYIATVTLERISRNRTPEQSFLSWNAGEGAKKCSSGWNKNKVFYDSCSYIQKAMGYYKELTNK